MYPTAMASPTGDEGGSALYRQSPELPETQVEVPLIVFAQFQESATIHRSIFLVRPLGRGLHGTAWLAVTTFNDTWRAFAVKRFRCEKAGDTAETELRFWKKVYPGKYVYPHVLHRSGYLLLLQYFFPVELDEKDKHSAKDPAVHEKLKELVRTQFWEKGIAHMDIRWCNIGWADETHQHLVLYDLALCKDFKGRSASDDGTPAEWAARMDSGSDNNLSFICDFAQEMAEKWRKERIAAAPQGA
jgi:hypothetical protein